MRAAAVRASVRYAVTRGEDPPVIVCPPCGYAHGESFFPTPGVETMHARVELTGWEREMAQRLTAAVRAGAVPGSRIETALGFDVFLEDFAEVTP
jgi:hypothetical protein